MSDIENEIRPGPVTPGREQQSVHVQRFKGANSQNNRLREIGERLTPDGAKHLGSIGIHIYKSSMGTQRLTVTQNCTDDANQYEANLAIQQSAFEIAKSYGWKPPATRQDVMQKDLHRDQGIILPADFGKHATPDDNTSTDSTPPERNTHGKEES